MHPDLRKWLRVSLFNLLLVATLGLIMRYKIAYSLPFVDQRNLLHAHSHFAFAGWITQAIMSLLVYYLFEKGNKIAFAKYRPLLYANLLTAYGMLFTFPFTGYALLSIIFSTLSIFVSYWFAIQYWRDLDKLKQKSTANRWFKAAVLFNAISSLGAFSLAYMMATKNIQPNRYLASVYFFLHFQYNGWFFFSCMGLLSHQLNRFGITETKQKIIYLLFVTACIPAYFLSALWLPVPRVIYLLVVIAVFIQLAGWILAVLLIRKALPLIKENFAPFSRSLLILSAAAFTIKLLLQAGSVIPSLSQLAFGFRPIIIGYLHLVLLGVITLFIIAYAFARKFIVLNKTTRTGVTVFTAGIIFNEALLMIQGIADLEYTPIRSINQLLLIAATVLLSGMMIINVGQQFSRYDSAHKAGENE
ncbi:MAG: hypothetical protein E6H09_12105 [Bacteroidetes bacterium]|jgi:hypothetical protein|nr:MAG: hypothetical protein E6H09_12105 [Bacteroidota bacterium]